MSLIWRCAAAFFVVAGCVLAQTNPYQNAFESYAARIQIFDTGDFVYDRSLRGRYCGDLCQPAAEFQDYLKANRLEPVRLQALLKHGDPKVRTLAMAALFDQEDPRFLPDFFALLPDAGLWRGDSKSRASRPPSPRVVLQSHRGGVPATDSLSNASTSSFKELDQSRNSRRQGS